MGEIPGAKYLVLQIHYKDAFEGDLTVNIINPLNAGHNYQITAIENKMCVQTPRFVYV